MLGRLGRFKSLRVPFTRRFTAMGAEQSNILGDHKFPVSNCRIVVVGPKNGAPALAELANLPKDARILATGSNVEELRKDGELFTEANVLLFYSGNAEILTDIINEMPFLTWVHTIFAGLDNIMCPALADNDDIILTNARGVFSSSLAEYVMGACWYFAKDIPRMKEQQENKVWNQFAVTEMRGQTMGIVGYGNIGQHCAKLAKAYGMKVIGLRKNPGHSSRDPYIDEIHGMDELDKVMEQSDYVVSILPNTPQTRQFIKGKHFKKAKKGQIFINIGRGATVDESALITALKDGSIRGAALDVFTVEPLPAASELWGMPNVLISSHNADILVDSREQSVRLFNEQCKKFLAGEELDCIVDKKAGY